MVLRRGRGDWLVLIENFYKYIKECKNMKKIDSFLEDVGSYETGQKKKNVVDFIEHWIRKH